jgi:hypothetical protein
LDKVNLLEVFDIGWLEYIEDGDDVFVVEVAK